MVQKKFQPTKKSIYNMKVMLQKEMWWKASPASKVVHTQVRIEAPYQL